MRSIGPLNSGVAVGTDGEATANTDSAVVVSGRVVGVSVRYNDSPPAATTDVVIKTKGTAPRIPTITLLTLTDSATDVFKMPRAITHGTTGSVLASLAVAEPYPIDDFVNVKIDDANAGDSVDVWLLLE
jgi:hypothetical protein